MITLLIADDHPLYRDALRGALSLSLPALTLKEAGDLNTTVDILNN
jgi:DNA-binding NarL/FixJ family response regulator